VFAQPRAPWYRCDAAHYRRTFATTSAVVRLGVAGAHSPRFPGTFLRTRCPRFSPRAGGMLVLTAASLPSPRLEGDPITSNARWTLGLLAKLIARLAPKGVYALAVDRHGRTPEIHCVFEKDIDALKLARAVQADRAGGYPGWKSQCTFTLDEEACRTIAAALRDK
jgi:hypothetical protein